MKRILFVRIGALGDVLQGAVALTFMKKTYPDVRITWVVGSGFVPLVQRLQLVDKVVGINDRLLLNGSFIKRILTLLCAMRLIARSGRFDRVVVAYLDWRYRLLILLTRAKEKQWYRATGRRPIPLAARHRSFEYVRLLSGMDTGHMHLTHLYREVGATLRGHSSAEQFYPGCIALVPGGGNLLREDSVRRWPVENYVVLASALTNMGYEVVLVGAEQDQWASRFFDGIGVVNLIGQTDLSDLFNVMDAAAVVVSHDTGPLHMAALSHAGLVALFGPTDSNATLPLDRPRTVFLNQGNRVACSPCYDGRNFSDCSNAQCMTEISVASVIEAVKSLA